MLLRLFPLALVALAAACVPAGPKRLTLGPQTCNAGIPPAVTGMNVGEVFAGRGQRMVIIPPDTAPPQDRQSGRLIVFVDDKGWIARATCG